MRLTTQDKADLLSVSRSPSMREDSALLRATALRIILAAPDPGMALLDFLTNYSDFIGQSVAKRQFIEKEMLL